MQNAPREHSAICSTFIKPPFVFKTFVLSIFEWPLKTGFTVVAFQKGPDKWQKKQFDQGLSFWQVLQAIWIPGLRTNILLKNRKREVLEILEIFYSVVLKGKYMIQGHFLQEAVLYL